MANKIVKPGVNANKPDIVKPAAKRKKPVSNLPTTTKSSDVTPQRSRKRESPAHSNTHPPNLEKTKLNIGLASILAQAQPVVEVFGKLWGFVLIMSAILASTGFTVTSALVLMKGVGRLF
jgi:hypothetical protein